ncbi:hypothetical protein CCHR01_04079 [Colletotrichum chrysophilum]|uniref:Uncharacterized protein n=1 Tax=Colletotrichum chrysophilum TaxID=1836956 RepID=A0AAD9ASE6_9PEZI|nr:hypothetical protein CCHR01_04079 [Colletotrichum chrysophilum]
MNDPACSALLPQARAALVLYCIHRHAAAAMLTQMNGSQSSGGPCSMLVESPSCPPAVCHSPVAPVVRSPTAASDSLAVSNRSQETVV